MKKIQHCSSRASDLQNDLQYPHNVDHRTAAMWQTAMMMLKVSVSLALHVSGTHHATKLALFLYSAKSAKTEASGTGNFRDENYYSYQNFSTSCDGDRDVEIFTGMGIGMGSYGGDRMGNFFVMGWRKFDGDGLGMGTILLTVLLSGFINEYS